jgi:hypothetical protein
VRTNANTLVHNPGQEVHQSDLQALLFNKTDMHRQTLKMEEDMEFERGIGIKRILEIS